jgi:hypothetical protein
MKKRSGYAQNAKAVRSNNRLRRFKSKHHVRADSSTDKDKFQALYISCLIMFFAYLV